MPTDNPAVLIQQKFDSFEEFSALAVAWNADFRQLDAEQFKSDMFQAQLGPILISSARLGCHVEQRGTIPQGMRTFAIPEAGSTGMRWYGQNIGADVLLCFPTHKEIGVFSRPGLSVLTISIPEELLEYSLEQLGIPGLRKSIGSSKTIFQASRPLLDKLRGLLRQAPAIASSKYRNRFLISEYQDQLLSALLQVISHGQFDPVIHPTHNRNSLETVLEYIDANSDKPLRVTELCTVSGLPERSLLYLFRKELKLTPKSYLAGKRLYGVHRELWHSKPKHALISDIANHWGFWHMGQFAADYKRIFGELPSSTLKRGD